MIIVISRFHCLLSFNWEQLLHYYSAGFRSIWSEDRWKYFQLNAAVSVNFSFTNCRHRAALFHFCVSNEIQFDEAAHDQWKSLELSHTMMILLTLLMELLNEINPTQNLMRPSSILSHALFSWTSAIFPLIKSTRPLSMLTNVYIIAFITESEGF